MEYECLECGDEGFDGDVCPSCGSSNIEDMDIGDYGNIDRLDEVIGEDYDGGEEETDEDEDNFEDNFED